MLSINARRFANRISPVAGCLPDPHGDGRVRRRDYIDTGLMKAGGFLAFNMAFCQPRGIDPGGLYVDRGAGHAAVVRADPADPRGGSGVSRGGDRTGAASGALALNHITFRYPGQDQGEGPGRSEPPGPARRIRGDRGPSGSGKSTLMRLLLGFETPDSGT